MRIHRYVAGLALSTAAIVTIVPALSAASHDTHAVRAPHVSERVARDIAWSFGIVRIEEIALAGNRWEVAGRDQDGNEQMLDISAYDGRILN